MKPVRDNEAIRSQEFVAHSTQVNCLSIGPKSSQVLATGGEDCKVNIWRVGSASNIWTLGYNKSPIECLCFDSDEICIVSGAMNGSLKVFDLNEGKLARNLGSHQTNITSVQYHPYGEFVISGSADCTMKLWDVRNKACIETYSGHSKEVTAVRFSPDGKWVASASKDGTIMFWDLIASKHIDTIKVAPNYATSFEFNPAELSLGAITTSRTVKLWDLESMRAISYTPPESSMVKALAFSNIGNQMFTTAKNVLRVWDLEPTLKMVHAFDIGWDRIAEMKISNNDTVIAASFMSNFVSVWEVDVDQLQNGMADEAAQEKPSQSPPPSTGPTRSPHVSAGPSVSAQAQEKESKADYASEKSANRVSAPRDVSYKDLYDEYKEPVRRLAPPRLQPSQEEEEDEEEEDATDALPPAQQGSPAKDLAASVGESFWKKFQDSLKKSGLGGDDLHETDLGVPSDELDELLPPSAFPELRPQAAAPTPAVVPAAVAPVNRVAAPRSQPVTPKTPQQPSSAGPGRPVSLPVGRAPVVKSTNAEDKAEGLAVVGMRHLRLDAAQGRIDVASPSTPLLGRVGTADANARLNSQCHDMVDRLLVSSTRLPADLSNRLVSLRMLRQLWAKGEVMDAVDHLQGLADAMKLNNPQQVVLLGDFFSAVELKTGLISLDACVKILPILNDMLSNSTSWHNANVIFGAYKSLTSLLECFGELIRNTRSVIVAGGVDLTREARLNKCNACHAIFVQARSRLETLKHQFRQDSNLSDVLENYQRLCGVYCNS
eukprot:gene2300-2519_t